VQISPDEGSLIRLAGAIVMETNDEWAIGRGYFSEESMKPLFKPDRTTAGEPPPST